MARVVISDELRDRLLTAGGPVELVDGSGEVIARLKYSDIWPSLPPVAEPTREQLDASFNGPGNYPTAEVLAYARNPAAGVIRVGGHLIPDDFPSDEEIDRDLAAGRSKTGEPLAAWFAALQEGATPCP